MSRNWGQSRRLMTSCPCGVYSVVRKRDKWTNKPRVKHQAVIKAMKKTRENAIEGYYHREVVGAKIGRAHV